MTSQTRLIRENDAHMQPATQAATAWIPGQKRWEQIFSCIRDRVSHGGAVGVPARRRPDAKAPADSEGVGYARGFSLLN
ncbi:MAG: hypothetical protein QF570_12415 [Myxococcota bacterium]|jgi:hypothetical protein|nr:hypothetical protein [Myxococcota bacterium]